MVSSTIPYEAERAPSMGTTGKNRNIVEHVEKSLYESHFAERLGHGFEGFPQNPEKQWITLLKDPASTEKSWSVPAYPQSFHNHAARQMGKIPGFSPPPHLSQGLRLLRFKFSFFYEKKGM